MAGARGVVVNALLRRSTQPTRVAGPVEMQRAVAQLGEQPLYKQVITSSTLGIMSALLRWLTVTGAGIRVIDLGTQY
jgi:hypothetical protein